MEEGLPKPGSGLGPSVSDVLGDSMQATYMNEIGGGVSQGDTRGSDEVGILGETVDDGEHGALAFRSG